MINAAAQWLHPEDAVRFSAASARRRAVTSRQHTICSVHPSYCNGEYRANSIALYDLDFVGTLPTQAIYVCAGALGRQALEGGLKVPPALLVGGVVATVLAVWIVGRVAQEALKGLNVDGVDALVGSA